MADYRFKGWESITLEQFINISQADFNNETAVLEVAAVLLDSDVEFVKKNEPYQKVALFVNQVSDLLEKPPKNEFRLFNHITVNGKKLKPPKFIDRFDGSWWSNATYQQVSTTMQTLEILGKANEALNKQQLSAIPLMLAALFTHDDRESEEVLMQREKEILQMHMDVIWQCFFLLNRCMKNTSKGLKLYLMVARIDQTLQNFRKKLRMRFQRDKKG